MTPAFLLIAHACHHRAVWPYLRHRLNLKRRPLNRQDELELELFSALAPLLDKHPGDRVAVRRGCPERWLGALDQCLSIPSWFAEQAGPVSDLAERWAKQGSRNWQLPQPAESVALHPTTRRSPRVAVAA